MVTNSRKASHSKRYCTPNCQYFRCSKRALGKKKEIRGRTRIMCNFVDGDWCTGSRCTYSFCTKHKLRTDGTCGLSKRSKSDVDEDVIEEKYEKELMRKEKEENNYQSYIKDKYRKKLGSKFNKY